MLTKIAHRVGRKVGTFDILYPVQHETGRVTDCTVTTKCSFSFSSLLDNNNDQIKISLRNHGYIMGLDRALQMPKAVRETRERLNDKLIKLNLSKDASHGILW